MAIFSKQLRYTSNYAFLPCDVLHPWTTSCTHNSFFQFLKGIQGSAQFLFILYLTPLLINRTTDPGLLLQEICNFLRTCIFCASGITMTLSSTCITRWLLGRFYLINMGFIPGLIGGASIFFEDPSKRGLFSTYYLGVVADMYLQVFQESGLVSPSPQFHLLLFSVFSSGLLYCLRSLPDSYSLMWPLVPKKVPSDPEAQKHCSHKGNCLDSVRKVGSSYFLYGLLIQAFKVITLNFKLLLTKPSLFSQAVLNRKNIKFPLFFGLYVSLYKGVSCLLVNLRGRDEAWQSLLAGGVASLSYLIQPNFTLTCLAFSNLSQILCRECKKKFQVPSWPWEEILFMVSMGMILHARIAYTNSFPKSYSTIIDAITSGRSTIIYNIADKFLSK